jgi:hypothetical protein
MRSQKFWERGQTVAMRESRTLTNDSRRIQSGVVRAAVGSWILFTGLESNHEKRGRFSGWGQNPAETKGDANHDVERRIVKAVGIRFSCSRGEGGDPTNREQKTESGVGASRRMVGRKKIGGFSEKVKSRQPRNRGDTGTGSACRSWGFFSGDGRTVGDSASGVGGIGPVEFVNGVDLSRMSGYGPTRRTCEGTAMAGFRGWSDRQVSVRLADPDDRWRFPMTRPAWPTQFSISPRESEEWVMWRVRRSR